MRHITERLQKYNLTELEQKTTLLALTGKSNKELAIIFDVGLGTIKDRFTKIFKKTKVQSRSEMAFVCFKDLMDRVTLIELTELEFKAIRKLDPRPSALPMGEI